MEEVIMYKDSKGKLHDTIEKAKKADKAILLSKARDQWLEEEKNFIIKRYQFNKRIGTVYSVETISNMLMPLLSDGPIWEHFLEIREGYKTFKE